MQRYADHDVDLAKVLAWYRENHRVQTLRAMFTAGYGLYHTCTSVEEPYAQNRIAADFQHAMRDLNAEDALPSYVLYPYAEQNWLH